MILKEKSIHSSLLIAKKAKDVEKNEIEELKINIFKQKKIEKSC
ncbi:Uncharacterised protein [Metamycoplasma alkalescens]|uniref:Uncharacterized protein n=1 Tax=Metamycoplasma alkalescens TaxID=45363 RepID=A0A3B0NZT7_9BACT|nr:Uncharacterised protein [Metamycoplasma alkalescens]